MKSYALRKIYEGILRKSPDFISNTLVDIFNPLRKNNVKKKLIQDGLLFLLLIIVALDVNIVFTLKN